MKRGRLTTQPYGSLFRWHIDTSDEGNSEGGPYETEEIARQRGEQFAKDKGIELVEERGVDMEMVE